jgi:hypothetical protein
MEGFKRDLQSDVFTVVLAERGIESAQYTRNVKSI